MARGKLLNSHNRPIYLNEDWRARIGAGVLLQRLAKHAKGEIDMTPTQIKAAEILLRKVLPDLAAVEMSGEIQHSVSAVELPDDALASIAAGGSARAAATPSGPQEPASVH